MALARRPRRRSARLLGRPVAHHLGKCCYSDSVGHPDAPPRPSRPPRSPPSSSARSSRPPSSSASSASRSGVRMSSRRVWYSSTWLTRRGSRRPRARWSECCSTKFYSHPRPRQYGSSWLSHDWAVPKSVSAPNVNTLAHIAYGSLFDSLWRVSLSLPPHLLLSLIYRVVVLHFAARIVPVIRKSTGWDGESDAVPNFWDGRSLGEEPAVSVVLCLSGVTTHSPEHAHHDHCPLVPPAHPHRSVHPPVAYVLSPAPPLTSVLDAGSQTWWRWINITLFLAVWSLELLLDADDDAESSVGRWKVE